MVYKGGCYCGEVKYTLDVSPDDARTSLCHCLNCKKFFGSAFGLTTKVPVSSFSYTADSKKPTIHEADQGSGTILHREFCSTCGSGILEVGERAMKDFRYIMTGTLDNPGDLPPKGEFWCKRREKWMPEIPGIFHKQEIKDQSNRPAPNRHIKAELSPPQKEITSPISLADNVPHLTLPTLPIVTMLGPIPRHLLLLRPLSAPLSLRPFRPSPVQTRLSTTSPPQKPRSWKSLFVRAGLAVGVVYYYNTSKLFAEEPAYAVPPPPKLYVEEEETALPILDSLITPREATAPVPTLASQPYIEPSTTTTPSTSGTPTPPAAPSLSAAPQQTHTHPSPETTVPADSSLPATEEEASQQGAFNEETGEINWDCPCLGGMAHGSCGEQFRAAFSCFVYSTEEPKGMDCIEKFKSMQGCFREFPEEYGAELEDEEEEEEQQRREGEAGRSVGMGVDGKVEAGEAQTYANGEPLPEAARKGVLDAERETLASPSSPNPPTATASSSPTSTPVNSSSSPTGQDSTQRAKAAPAQLQDQPGDPLSESESLVPKVAHDARGRE